MKVFIVTLVLSFAWTIWAWRSGIEPAIAVGGGVVLWALLLHTQERMFEN